MTASAASRASGAGQRAAAEPRPVEVVGVGEAGAADGAVGEPVLGVDEKVPSQRAGGAEGPPAHRAHVALAAAHHGGVLWDAAERERAACQRTTRRARPAPGFWSKLDRKLGRGGYGTECSSRRREALENKSERRKKEVCGRLCLEPVALACSHLVNMGNELLGAAEIKRTQRTHEAAAVLRPFFALLGRIRQR